MILVAVDGSEASWDAVAWAAAEAAAVGTPLRIVHVVTCLVARGMFGPQAEGTNGMAPAAEGILVEAVRRAHDVAPGLDTSGQLIAGDRAGAAIVRAAANDSLIVLGRSRRRHGLLSRLRPSVVEYVASRASCPVIVVGLAAHSDGPATGRVVVAIDDLHPDPATVLALAYRAADRRGIGVTVLEQLNRRATLGAALVVIGTRGRTGAVIEAVRGTLLIVPAGRPSFWAPLAAHVPGSFPGSMAL